MAEPHYNEFYKIGMVGPQDLSDKTLAVPRLGNGAEVIVQQIAGKYFEWTRRGYVFAARTATAAAIPKNDALTNSPTLWNKASSGKLVVPLCMTLSCVAIGTEVMAGFTVSVTNATGDTVATGLPLATFTNVVPATTLLGSGLTCQTQYAHGTVTFTTNPTAIADLGLGQYVVGTIGSANSGGQQFQMFDFDGLFILKPGTAISIGGTAASSSTYNPCIYFAEIPLIAGV